MTTTPQQTDIPFHPPAYTAGHRPGELRVDPKWAYVPPVRPGFKLNLDREETTSNTGITLAEADRRRKLDFPIQETNRFPSRLIEKALTTRIADANGLAETNVLMGNGVMSMMTYLYDIYTTPDTNVTVPTPGFWPAYTYAIQRARGIWMPMYRLDDSNRRRPQYIFPYEDTVRALDRRSSLCYLCNPNNPTGTLIPAEAISELVAGFPNVLFILDEAYGPFAANRLNPTDFQLRNGLKLLHDGHKNLLIARTFSKVYAMANYRVGYVLGHPTLIETVRAHMGPYDMSEIAVAMAYYNFQDDAYMKEIVTTVVRNKSTYEAFLEERGVRHYGGYRNSILVEGLQLGEAYEANGIAVRSMTFQGGIPNPISSTFRVTIPSDAVNFKFFLDTTRSLITSGVSRC